MVGNIYASLLHCSYAPNLSLSVSLILFPSPFLFPSFSHPSPPTCCREAVMVYTPSPDIDAPTVVAVPYSWQYGNNSAGYDVTLSPDELATWSPGRELSKTKPN